MKTYYQLLGLLRRNSPKLDGIEAFYPFVCPTGSTVEGYTFKRDVIFDSLMDIMPWIRKKREEEARREELEDLPPDNW